MTDMEFKKRKPTRLQGYDYSRTGVYFITVCTKERRNYFWNNVGATIGRPQDIELSPYGVIVDEAINKIPEIYPSVSIKQYVIMPDHIHMLVLIRSDDNRRPMVAPTISRLVNQMKGFVSKQIGFSVWQKLFYDHIIRNRQDYEEHMKYIHENPKRWYYEHLNHGE